MSEEKKKAFTWLNLALNPGLGIWQSLISEDIVLSPIYGDVPCFICHTMQPNILRC